MYVHVLWHQLFGDAITVFKILQGIVRLDDFFSWIQLFLHYITSMITQGHSLKTFKDSKERSHLHIPSKIKYDQNRHYPAHDVQIKDLYSLSMGDCTI